MAKKVLSKALSDEEYKKWRELDLWIRKNIMGYDDNQGLNKEMALILMGMRYRQRIGNNTHDKWCNYSFSTILNTYKACSLIIKKGMQGKHFKNDMHKFNYAAKIVESKLSEVYAREQYAKQAREEAERKEAEETQITSTPKYKPKKRKDKEKFSDLW